jgi:class 3 adenylate cyclase
VTFLLTDIEGSTLLLRRLGDDYGAMLTELRRLQRGAVRRYHGREVDARADEFFAVFGRPPEALQAALAIQRAVGRRAWPGSSPVRVRIGLHTGAPTRSDGGYVGLSVNTAARVAFAGHGGQIVVSDAARAALAGAEPSGVEFSPLGSHQLHGLPEPVALYEVRASDLPSGFPPPRIGIPAAVSTRPADAS